MIRFCIDELDKEGAVSLVQMTRPDGSPVAINPDEIVHLAPVPSTGPLMGPLTVGTRIVFRNQSHQDVKELFAEVVARINAARGANLNAVSGAMYTRIATSKPPANVSAPALSFAHDIRPLFTDGDVACMAGNIDLTSYDDLKGHAQAILSRLSNPDPSLVMPPSGPWPDAQIALFASWIKGGCQA
jgi:hypothetical protein